MRSISLVFAFGAVAHAAEECHSDEATLLQGGVRGRKAKKFTTAGQVRKALEDLASTMTEEGFVARRSDVDDALAAADDALAQLTPTIQASVTQAQQQINDAAAAVQFCHAASGVTQRESLLLQRNDFADSLAECLADLQNLQNQAEMQCGIAQDCLCDEANERVVSKEEVCDTRTQLYEVAYCEHNLACTQHVDCHTAEIAVYNQLRTDVEAEIVTIRNEYVATTQSQCLMGVIISAISTGTPIDLAAQAACLNVDGSVIAIDYPTMPAAPDACPAAEIGSPQCAGTGSNTPWDQPCTAATATIDGVPVCTVASNDGNADPWVLFGDINHQINNFVADSFTGSASTSGLYNGDSVQVGTFSDGEIGSPGYSLDIGQFCTGGTCTSNFDLMIQYGDASVYSYSNGGYSPTNGGFINNAHTAQGVVIGEHGMWGSQSQNPNGYYATFCAYNGGCRGNGNDFWAFSTHGVYPNAASSVVCGMYYGGSSAPWKNCPSGDNGHRMRYYIRSADLEVML